MAKEGVDTSSWETFKFKLALLGDASVGKSCLAVRFVRGDFFEYQEPTIGAAFMTQTLPLHDKHAIVKFEIWDTAGQERYKSLAPMYYRGAAAAAERAGPNRSCFWTASCTEYALFVGALV